MAAPSLATFIRHSGFEPETIPLGDRRAALHALARLGYDDLAAGRLGEGHVNALELIGRLGTPEQSASALADVRAGRLFGVWNTQDRDGVKIVRSGGQPVITGRKTFASGAGTVARAVVSAAWPDGSSQLLVLPMDEIAAEIDRFSWRPLGMHDSDSFAVRFDGVTLPETALLGEPNAYEAPPWFLGGAIRFVAVHCGALERLRDETIRLLHSLGRTADPFQRARIADIALAAREARLWIDAGADVWRAYDADPSEARADAIVALTDMARTAVERAAHTVIERVAVCVGARGLLEPEPFARLLRDLQMYIRQPAPDATILRIAAAAESALVHHDAMPARGRTREA
jgi:alkylation response protein AidB-like acyl-CoA dehydrogenase